MGLVTFVSDRAALDARPTGRGGRVIFLKIGAWHPSYRMVRLLDLSSPGWGPRREFLSEEIALPELTLSRPPQCVGRSPRHLTTSTPRDTELPLSFLHASLLSVTREPRGTVHLRGALRPKTDEDRGRGGPDTEISQQT